MTWTTLAIGLLLVDLGARLVRHVRKPKCPPPPDLSEAIRGLSPAGRAYVEQAMRDGFPVLLFRREPPARHDHNVN